MKYKHVVANRYGGSDVLQIVEDDVPEPPPHMVRVRILAAGVSFADVLIREGIHPEAHRPPLTPGWDLVGVVDGHGRDVHDPPIGQMVAALPIVGGYSQYICLPPQELVPVDERLDPGKAVSLVLNYVTAYQMLHRTAQVADGQTALIHSAGGGVGTALLQLGTLVKLKMYGTVSPEKHELVRSLGGIPINYKQMDFVDEIARQTGDGVDVVFDGIGGQHLWRSYQALRCGGKVVTFGHATGLIKQTSFSGRRGRLRGLPTIAAYIIRSALTPDGKRIALYSIQTLKRRRPEWFRKDLTTLFSLLSSGQIEPVIAARLPLEQVAQAHELVAKGAHGRIVLLCE